MSRIGLAIVGALALVAATVTTVPTLRAQLRSAPPPQAKILSGSDIGFRVEGVDPRTGGPTGTWMLRVNGEWVEIGSMPTVKRLK